MVMLEMMSTFTGLAHITTYMNLPTDLEQKMQINRERRQAAEEQRQQIRESQADALEQGAGHENVAYAVDKMPIAVEELTYYYLCRGGKKSIIIKDCALSISQGCIVAMVGPRSQGKA